MGQRCIREVIVALTVFQVSFATSEALQDASPADQGVSGAPAETAGSKTWEVSAADLVIVYGTTSAGHHPELVKATRFWRKGLAAFIASNEGSEDNDDRVEALNNELRVVYPDSNDGRTQYPGDTRAALAPLLAHKALRGQYKWMLYGDDDTLWFIAGVLALAGQLDPSLPYLVTDAGYWHHWNKAGFHSRFMEDGPLQCLPCSFSSEAWHEGEGAAFTPPIGCPCTTQLLCEADKRGIMGSDCSMPEWFRMIHHMDGGAGALLSHGLLEAINTTTFEACATAGDGIASDYLFSFCMWQSGFAPTFPTFSRMPKDTDKRQYLFNPGGILDLFHNPDRASIVHDLLAAVELKGDRCDSHCLQRLTSMVSLHLKSQRTANMQAGIFMMRSISSLYDSFLATVNRTDLTVWPLVHQKQFKQPVPGWNKSDIPVMQPSQKKYNFGFVAHPPGEMQHHHHEQQLRRMHG